MVESMRRERLASAFSLGWDSLFGSGNSDQGGCKELAALCSHLQHGIFCIWYTAFGGFDHSFLPKT